ncbi:LysR family transcriptional regulator [Thalassotalea atypica]|uniref:LysR family transcriptional regulator n=1 Tax=Thalassotalea atypica TaxID=2054316 RepID=UPI0025737A28|nr:LysR family transcriptional regulator [Thalassotalea atypica]
MLNPNWLNTFVALVDSGHFTKTAEKLFMTQPGVSQHINKLEKACGHSLIIRTKKSFVITEQGRLVYHYAKKLMFAEHTLFEHLAFDDPYSGDCTLACSGSVSLLLYPKLLEIQCQHPNLVVKLKAAPNHQILFDIKEGVIDQGIVTDIPNKIFYDAKELGKEELYLVVPANIDTDVDISKLTMELGLIHHPDAEHYLSLYFSQNTEQNLEQVDISSIPIVGAINQISQILEPISTGIGFTVLPKSAVESFHNVNRLKVIKLNKPVIETLYLVKQKQRVLPARFKTINNVVERIWR